MNGQRSARFQSGRGWAYLGAVLGGVASVAANVAHSYVPPAGEPARWATEPGAVIGAAFWPLALLVAVEILARVEWPDGRLVLAVRVVGVGLVAVVAAVVSYLHLSGLLAHYGDSPVTVLLGPLAVDGLMLTATAALVVTGRTTAGAASGVQPVTATSAEHTENPADNPADNPEHPESSEQDAPEAAPRPARRVRQAQRGRGAPPARTGRPGRPAGRSPVAAKVARLAQQHPEWTTSQIAMKAGCTDRTVRRHLNRPATDTSSAEPTEPTVPVDGEAAA